MKFIHTADVHLLALSDPDAKRRLGVLKEICELARDRDGLVIAGDLFHIQNSSRDTALCSALKDALAAAAPKPVLIIPGNHDRRGGKGPHPFDGKLELGSHVRQLGKDPYDETVVEGVRFYGIPFQSGQSGLDLLKKLPKEAAGSVVILHGTAVDRANLAMSSGDKEEGSEDSDCVFRDADLEAVKAAYFAFGHIHKPVTWTLKSGAGAYPGSPDAVSVKEEDRRRVLEVELVAGAAPVIREVDLQMACRYSRLDVLVMPGAEAEALKEAEEVIKAQPPGVKPAVYLRGLGSGRLLAEGKRSLEALFAGRDPVPVVKVKATPLDDDQLSSAGLLKDFMESLRQAAKNPDPGVTQDLLSRAAFLGWHALLGDKDAMESVLENLGGRHEA